LKDQKTSKKICYFDCSSGVSGDMILGTLVDAGVPLQKLKRELSRLKLKGYRIKAGRVIRGGFRARKVDVIVEKPGVNNQVPRRWRDIEEIVFKSALPEYIKEKGLLIFKKLFNAEAKAHGKAFKNVHLHELGAVDCIIDIFGTLIGLDILGIETVYSSPLNLGSGTLNAGHGLIPVPAPATAQLLKDIPVYSSDVPLELTTPTGAVILSCLAREFIPMPEMRISSIGIGAGSINLNQQPNILRLFIGRSISDTAYKKDKVVVIETNIDDMNPQVYEYVMERLFKAGALDVFLTQIIMKKGRPGIKLTVLSDENKKQNMVDIILKETTTIGLRYYKTERSTLQRKTRKKKTRFGQSNVKITQVEGMQKVTPEYNDCKRIAKKYNVPLVEVLKVISSPSRE
jgi:uncharacterized protein (TIGR00299 family) protein